MNREMKWMSAVFFALMGAALLVACGDDATTTTAPSIASGNAELTGPASVRSQGDGSEADDASDNSGDDEDSVDDSNDDNSIDDNSIDDDSNDDDSIDDDSIDDADRSGGDEDRVRGLFFGMEGCPAAALECVLALRIKDTLVVVTATTQIDNEPALVEDLTPDELRVLLTGRLGLPLRARGVSSGGNLVASELRIDDEIRASGVVVAPALGCDLSLLVRGTTSLCFELSGLRAPAVGTEARIEGIVPMDLTSPFRATALERLDN